MRNLALARDLAALSRSRARDARKKAASKRRRRSDTVARAIEGPLRVASDA